MVVDRVVVRPDIGGAAGGIVRDRAQARRRHGGGRVRRRRGAERTQGQQGKNDTAERLIFSEKFACPVSGFTIPEIEPRLFSFNNPFGACPACGGLGVEQQIDADLVIPDKDTTLRKGAIAPWAKSSSPYYMQTLEALGKHYRFTLDTKWKDLPKKAQDAILYGSGEDAIRFIYDDGMRSYETKKPFEGVITNLERRWRETESDWAREEIAKYFTDIPCAACNGYRLKPEALCVQDRRPPYRRSRRDVGQARRRMVHRAAQAARRQAERDRRARAQGDPRAAASSWSTSGSNISRSPARPARCRAARASASGSPRRSAPG